MRYTPEKTIQVTGIMFNKPGKCGCVRIGNAWEVTPKIIRADVEVGVLICEGFVFQNVIQKNEGPV